MRLAFYLLLVANLCLGSLSSMAYPGLVWPTPNPAFQNGESIEAFIQPTASGKKESGLFGCVRNNGHKFHEGIDLYPIVRDKRGEALDEVFAVLPGRVVYINTVSGYSSYGRYVVIEHDLDGLVFHTLYAHLARVRDTTVVGKYVELGTPIGIMGRSASTTIPRSRAHLHFEIGVRLTDDFQAWYDRQKFSTKNRHGNWNGMNLISVDPLDFYRSVRNGSVSNLHGYLQKIPTYARIRIHTSVVPDFVKRYPRLVTRPYLGSEIVAWDIAFSRHGVPKEWSPRFADESVAGEPGDVEILAYNPELLNDQTCFKVVLLPSSGPKVSAATLTTLKKLFGFK